MNTAYIDVKSICRSYAPYDTFPEFSVGYNDALAGAPCRDLQGVAGQGYDRGYEAGCKVQRMAHWIENNVGAN